MSSSSTKAIFFQTLRRTFGLIFFGLKFSELHRLFAQDAHLGFTGVGWRFVSVEFCQELQVSIGLPVFWRCRLAGFMGFRDVGWIGRISWRVERQVWPAAAMWICHLEWVEFVTLADQANLHVQYCSPRDNFMVLSLGFSDESCWKWKPWLRLLPRFQGMVLVSIVLVEAWRWPPTRTSLRCTKDRNLRTSQLYAFFFAGFL